MKYDIRGYYSQKGFDNREYTILAEDIPTKKKALFLGKELFKKEPYTIIKVQSADREFIKLIEVNRNVKILKEDVAVVNMEILFELLKKEGVIGVIRYAKKIKLPFSFCVHCNSDTPIIKFGIHNSQCGICGQNVNSIYDFNL